MAQTILEMATDLVIAQIQAQSLPPEAMHKALQHTYASLMALQTQGANRETPLAAGDWRKSIGRHAVTCLECGVAYKQLARHLREHDLDTRSYRSKYSIPSSQPLVARSITAMRQKMVQETRTWEKTPRYVIGTWGEESGEEKSSAGEGVAQRELTVDHSLPPDTPPLVLPLHS